jgi:hypothetical protein
MPKGDYSALQHELQYLEDEMRAEFKSLAAGYFRTADVQGELR